MSGSRVRTAVRLVGCGLLLLVSLCWPRDDRTWVFGARGGEAFLDNSKHLYLHVRESVPNVRPVWIAKDHALVAELQEQGYESYHASSARGIYYNLRARVVFVSHGVADVNRWCCGGATVVNLWHGIALKHIGWDHGYTLGGVVARFVQRCKLAITDRYDYFVVTSEAMIEPFVSAFRIESGRIAAVGYPRNDALVNPEPVPGLAADRRARETLDAIPDSSDVVCYFPTYHAVTGEDVVDHLNLPRLDAFLAEVDAHLLLKLHPSERLDTDLAAFDRIVPLPGAADAYSILPETDALVTDYSSVYFDYLLCDEPVVFYPFDLEAYRAKRGFYLDYDAVTPGPIATDFEGLCACLERVLETDDYAAERASVRERYLGSTTESRSMAVCRRFAPPEVLDEAPAVRPTGSDR